MFKLSTQTINSCHPLNAVLSFNFTEQIGGGAEAFRTVGQKWRDLSESDKESYRKKAADSGPAVSMPSKDERARRIIRNIMKEITAPMK